MTTWAVAGSCVRVVGAGAFAVASAALLGLHSYGLVAAAIAASRFISPAAEFGGRLNLYDEYRQQGYVARRTIVRLTVTRLSIASVLSIAVGVTSAAILDIGIAPAIALALGTIVAALIQTFSRVVLVVANRRGELVSNELARAVALQLPVIAILAGASATLDSFSYLYCAGAVAGMIPSAWWIWRAAEPAPAAAIHRSIHQNAYSSVGLIAQQGSMLLDQFMLGGLAGGRASAIYSLAASSGQAALVPVSGLADSRSPNLFSKENASASRKYQRLVLVTIVAGGALGFLSWTIIGPLFGIDAWREIALVTVAVALLTIPRGVALPQILRAHRLGRDRERAIADATAMVLNVTINLLLIPRIGILGALTATALSETLFFVLVVRVPSS